MSISPQLRQQVIERANACCEYCQTQQCLIGMPLVIDHIKPRVLGGDDSHLNLAASCHRCNTFKGAKTQAVDPATNIVIVLFNPRKEDWPEHFAWIEQATLISGKTPMGRATVEALSLNNPYVVESRRIWVAEDWHPPKIMSER
ncbi:MAG: HNH endonuclease signature motif containing protein [Cyanobacteria bacterium P01_G01_bin.54]